MARALGRLGGKLGLADGLLGLLTALGADAPELSSAVIAILAGSREVGVGVVLGSNLFNLAALLGLSALVSGGLHLHRGPVVLDGAIGLLMLLGAGAVLAGWLPAGAAAAVLLLIFAVYATALSLPGPALRRLGLRGPILRALVLAPGHLAESLEPDRASGGRSWWPVALLPLAIAGVVGGALGLVRSALAISSAAHVTPGITGGLVLAVLTSIPNAYTAVHLGRRGRGTAVMSEAMNSNSINLLGGLVLPAAILGAAAAGPSAVPTYGWLLGLTFIAIALPLWRQRLGRPGAVLMIAVYLAYAGFTLRP